MHEFVSVRMRTRTRDKSREHFPSATKFARFTGTRACGPLRGTTESFFRRSVFSLQMREPGFPENSNENGNKVTVGDQPYLQRSETFFHRANLGSLKRITDVYASRKAQLGIISASKQPRGNSRRVSTIDGHSSGNALNAELSFITLFARWKQFFDDKVEAEESRVAAGIGFRVVIDECSSRIAWKPLQPED